MCAPSQLVTPNAEQTYGWHGNEAELRASLPEVVTAYQAAVAAEDFEAAAILVGESIGLIHAVHPAADIVARWPLRPTES